MKKLLILSILTIFAMRCSAQSPNVSTVQNGATSTYCSNDPSNGTVLYELVKLSSAGVNTCGGAAVTDTAKILGVCVLNCGNSGIATIAVSGSIPLIFDGTPTANDYVVNSTTSARLGHDAGATRPTAASQLLGYVMGPAALVAGAYNVQWGADNIPAGTGGGGVSGSGTIGTLPLFNGTTAIGNSDLLDSTGAFLSTTVPFDSAILNNTFWVASSPSSCTVGNTYQQITLNPDCTIVGVASVSNVTGTMAGTGTCYVTMPQSGNAPNAIINVALNSGAFTTASIVDQGFSAVGTSATGTFGSYTGSAICTGTATVTYTVAANPSSATQGGCGYLMACSKTISTNISQTLYTGGGIAKTDIPLVLPHNSTHFTQATVNFQGQNVGSIIAGVDNGSRIQYTGTTPIDHLIFKPQTINNQQVGSPVWNNVTFDCNNLCSLQTGLVQGMANGFINNTVWLGSIMTGPGSSQFRPEKGGGTGTTYQNYISQLSSFPNGSCVGSQEWGITVASSTFTVGAQPSTCNYANAHQSTENGVVIYPGCTGWCVVIHVSSSPGYGPQACSGTGLVYLSSASQTMTSPSIQVIQAYTGCPTNTVARALDVSPTEIGADTTDVTDSKVIQPIMQSVGQSGYQAGTVAACTVLASSPNHLIIDFSATLGMPFNIWQQNQQDYVFLTFTGNTCGGTGLSGHSYQVLAVNSPLEIVLSATAAATAREAVTGSVTYAYNGYGMSFGSGTVYDRPHIIYTDWCDLNSGGNVHDLHCDTDFNGSYINAPVVHSQDNYWASVGVLATNYKDVVLAANAVTGSIFDYMTCRIAGPTNNIHMEGWNGSAYGDISTFTAAQIYALGIQVSNDQVCPGSASVATDIYGQSATTNHYFNGDLTAATLNVATARKSTVTCTVGGSIVVANTNFLATSDVVFTLNTAGGTVSTAPAIKTPTPGTGFTVLCGAADTSVYNYDILN